MTSGTGSTATQDFYSPPSASSLSHSPLLSSSSSLPNPSAGSWLHSAGVASRHTERQPKLLDLGDECHRSARGRRGSRGGGEDWGEPRGGLERAHGPVRGRAAVKATPAELPHSHGGSARTSSATSLPTPCRPGVEATTAEGARAPAVRGSPMAAWGGARGRLRRFGARGCQFRAQFGGEDPGPADRDPARHGADERSEGASSGHDERASSGGRGSVTAGGTDGGSSGMSLGSGLLSRRGELPTAIDGIGGSLSTHRRRGRGGWFGCPSWVCWSGFFLLQAPTFWVGAQIGRLLELL
jgi:hypothetical protein